MNNESPDYVFMKRLLRNAKLESVTFTNGVEVSLENMTEQQVLSTISALFELSTDSGQVQ